MSLESLTHNAFRGGITAPKWVKLCKVYISKHRLEDSHEETESILSRSVLTLFRFYPGDHTLGQYLKQAIQNELVTLPLFVITFLQAARSPELHSPATLDMLCQVALGVHYTSGMPLVALGASTRSILGAIQDAFALLRTAHALPMSQYHQQTASASELVMLLLSYVSDVSRISTAQAMVLFSDASDMLQVLRLSPDFRHVLETFVLSLGLILGDDAKVAQEAHMMHTMQLALGKGDVLESSAETDIVTLSLLLQNMISYRGTAYGSGNETYAVTMLVTALRSISWSPAVFYSQLLLSATKCLSQACIEQSSSLSDSKPILLWRAFILGRLPRLLAAFETTMGTDNTVDADWRAATRAAVTALVQHSDLLTSCDRRWTTSDNMTPSQDSANPQTFLSDLLHQLVGTSLVDEAFAISFDSAISASHPLQTESQELGVDIETYLESKFTPDVTADDLDAVLKRVVREFGSHSAFAQVVCKRFIFLANGLDVEPLSQLSKMLYRDEQALDIISLHVGISELVAHGIVFVEDYDCETVGDPQTAVSHLGEVVLFLQLVLTRFRLSDRSFMIGDRILRPDVLLSTACIHRIGDMPEEDAVAFNAWFKALFDISCEGIEDNILRSTKPKTLLRISATLFSRAIAACADKIIDTEILNNGVSYFQGPLLNWTLVGVVKALVAEISRKQLASPTHLEVLHVLLLSSACPRPVTCLTGRCVLRLLSDHKSNNLGQTVTFNTVAIRQQAIEAMEAVGETPLISPMARPQQNIRDALAFVRAGRAPTLDVGASLLATTATKFLQTLWSELSAAAKMGEMDTCRRIATYTLTMAPSPNMPPLLPIFLQSLVPVLIMNIDQQTPPEQTVNVELLVAVLSSSLTAALHLERTARSVQVHAQNPGRGEPRISAGQSCLGMARRLAGDLRRKNSPTCGALVQRIASSPGFIANFPMLVI